MSKTGTKILYVFSEIQYANLIYILIINYNNDNFLIISVNQVLSTSPT